MTKNTTPRSDGEFCFGPFSLSVRQRLLKRGGTPVSIGGRALAILITLIDRAGEVVSNRELVAQAWSGVIVDEGALRVHIASLRKALGDGKGDARYVINVPGRGYSFVAAIESSGAGPKVAQQPMLSKSSAYPTPNLPPRLQRMIGRDETVPMIIDQLYKHRFVTIVAPGGMGKTTVAAAVAHSVIDAFEGVIKFIDLGSVQDPSYVAETLSATLGLNAQSSDPIPALIASLATQRLLLVLDNCERVVDAIAPLAERIFNETPSVHILATSREALRVEGEHVHRLRPLESPGENSGLSAAEALTFPAVQLFVERAAASGMPFELTDEDAPIVGGICRRLDGLALAIELAAGRVNAHGFRGTAALLNTRFRLEWQGRRTALPRHQTLNAMLDWSYSLLSEQERLSLARLSIFVGPFTASAAEDVVIDPDGEPFCVPEVVTSLVERSLLSVSHEGSTTKYRLLETTREYALRRLNSFGEVDKVAARHASLLQRIRS